MTTKQSLTYQVSTLPNCYIPKVEDFLTNTHFKNVPARKISAFNEPVVNFKEPKVSQWDCFDHDQVVKLVNLKMKYEIREFIGSTIRTCPRGRSGDMFIELLCDVTKFCRENEFDVEKSGTILSQFYLVHLYFTSGLDISAEKVYLYFKDLTMCHSLPFPPSSKKIFILKEAKQILEFFCKIYLRNLPLIRYLCLPNFALNLNYEIPPPPIFNLKEKKAGKSKKAHHEGGKKGKKKK